MNRSQTSRVLLVAMLFGGAALMHSQVPEPTDNLSVQATSVVVDVIVSDRRGHAVTGLTANDFKVYEEGVEQKVTTFVPPPPDASTASLALSEKTSAAPSTAAQGTSQSSALSQQFITVVLDLNDNRPTSIKTSCDTVIRYLRKNKAQNTEVAIYYLTQRLELALPFTADLGKAEVALQSLGRRAPGGSLAGGDRASLIQEINELYSRANPISQYGASPANSNPTPGERSAPSEPQTAQYARELDTMRSYLQLQNSYHARQIFVALRALALSYRDLPGRKNVVLFSEGFSFDRDSRSQLENVIAAANQANVSFYVFDPSGLGTGLTLGSAPNNQVSQMNQIATEGSGQHGGQSKFDHLESALTQNELHTQLGDLARETGGLIVYNTNDLGPAFAHVLEDTRNFYTLVYHPTNKEWQGNFRRLKVVLSKSDYLVRHRQGYWAIPRGESFAMTPLQAHLFSSVRQGLITATIKPPLLADVALAPDSHWYAPFSVSIPVSAVLPAKDAVDGRSELVLVGFAYDNQGKLLSTYERHLDVARGTTEVPHNGSLTFHGQLALPKPEAVQVQIIMQMAGEKFALALQHASPARSSDQAPLLSSLVVTDQIDQAQCDDLTESLCVTNIRLRERVPATFAKSAKLLAYFAGSEMALDPATKHPRVGAQFVVRSGDKVVATVPAGNVQALPGNAPGSVRFIAEVALDSLPKGDYVLQGTAFDLLRKKSSSQTREFSIQ